MIVTMIFLPICASLVLGTLKRKTDISIRQIALTSSIIVWILGSILWVQYISGEIIQTTLENGNIIGALARLGQFRLGIDGISLLFVELTIYLIPIAILSTWNTVTHNNVSQLILLLLLESILIVVFTSLDLIIFYVSFEAVLIPLFIIIVLHGSTEGRIRASMLLFLYTLTGSFFMLLSILKLYSVGGTSDMLLLSIIGPELTPEFQRWIWIGIFFSIAIKSPLVPVHLWLFRAHAESSLAGSILLAGIILKLSTYAYLRLLIPILPDACEYFRPLVLTLACVSLIHGSLATLRQTDSKVFVAYSSVAHLAVIILGLSSGTTNGIIGSILLSIAHGLISPALFIIVGGILYDRYVWPVNLQFPYIKLRFEIREIIHGASKMFQIVNNLWFFMCNKLSCIALILSNSG
jgi:NADH-ubiquinone oxidoreductase chain 4